VRPAYPAYRPSEHIWLKRVPAHWRERKLKFAARAQASNVDKKTTENEQAVQLCNYTEVYNHEKIAEGLPFMWATATQREIEKFQLCAGDVMITKDSESWADIAVPAWVPADLDGVLCGYHLSHIRPNPAELDGAYLYFLLASEAVNYQFRVAANGVTRFGLPAHDIDQAAVVLPPLDEQRAIVCFLDAKTAEIDGLIGRKQRLLELLAEQRSALITKAVTKGLNPNAPLKSSGLPWLGDVPAHWGVKRLDLLNDAYRPIMYGIVLPGPNVDDGVPIIKGGDVRPDRLAPNRLSRTTFEIDEAHATSRVRGGDIVYAIRGSYGDAEIVPSALSGANLTQDTARIAPAEGVSTDWLLYALKAEPTRQQLASRSLGATIKGVNIRDLKRAMLAVPPVSEQAGIARHLAALDERGRRLQNAVETHVERLREMRSALITAAVTGQIDVRGWDPRKAAA
jgi:type I restriction enzyme S subunit